MTELPFQLPANAASVGLTRSMGSMQTDVPPRMWAATSAPSTSRCAAARAPVALVVAAEAHRDARFAGSIDGFPERTEAEQAGELPGRPADVKWPLLPVLRHEHRWRHRVEQPGQGGSGRPEIRAGMVGGVHCHGRPPMASA